MIELTTKKLAAAPYHLRSGSAGLGQAHVQLFTACQFGEGLDQQTCDGDVMDHDFGRRTVWNGSFDLKVEFSPCGRPAASFSNAWLNRCKCCHASPQAAKFYNLN